MTIPGRHKACTQCRDRKVRCDGAQPKCRGCARHGHECYYAPTAKRYSKADFAVMLEGMNRRILQAEAAATTNSTVNRTAASPWPGLPTASTAQTTPSGVSPELAFPFSSPLQTAANSDFAMALDGMNKRLLPTGEGGNNPASARPVTSDLNFDYSSSFQPPASSAPAAVHENDPNNQLGAVASQSAHFGFRDQSETPFSAQSSAFESAHQPLPLFGGLNFGFHFDPSTGSRLNNSHTTTGPPDSVILHPQRFPISPATSSEKRRRVSAEQDNWWPCDNDWFDQAALTNDTNNNRRQGSVPNTVTSRSQPAGPGSQGSQSRHSGSRATSQSSETAAGSAQYTDSTIITPNTSPTRTSSPILNQCSSSMRRKIGNGASFQSLPTLNGPENYNSWVRAIRAAARKEGVWDMMTGVCERPSTPRPDASPTSKQRHNDDMTYWLNKRELALGAIEGSLADDLQARIENIECAREVWLTLERECKVSKEQALLDAIKRLRNLSGEPSVGGIERLACRVQELRADMQCITTLPQVPEWYFTVQFLVSLPPVFDSLVSSVTSSSPCTIDLGSDGSLEQVVALAKAEEKQIFATAS
ncbi:RNA polymerase II-specific transcription factor-like protein [Microdochium nivale]|nr:RNA polymerase II-specific transcription factor-like protein [Microdochium nivale]